MKHSCTSLMTRDTTINISITSYMSKELAIITMMSSFMGLQESDCLDLPLMSSTGYLTALSFVTDSQIPHIEHSCSQIKHIKTNPMHNSSLLMNLDGFIAHKNNTILDWTRTHDNIQYRRFPHTTLYPTWCGKFDKEDVLPLNKLPRYHNKMLTPSYSQLIVTEQTDYPLKQRHLQSGLKWNDLQLPQIPSGTASWNPDIQNLLLVTNAWLHE